MADLEEQQKHQSRADIKKGLRPIIEAGKYVWSVLPARLKRHRLRFSFILAHYCYILGMTITISIMLYPANPMPYIDALFFAAGVATQSGLNTIDVNSLNTYQQSVIMLMTCTCTPIFINIVVVLIRLYWFEKRFKHVVKEIRSQKRSKAKSIISRSRSQAREDEDDGVKDDNPSRLEMGVRGRRFTMIGNGLNLGGVNGAPENESTARSEVLDNLHMDDICESVNPTSGARRSDSTDRKGKTVSDDTTLRNPPTLQGRPQRMHTPIPIPTPTPALSQTPGVFYLGLSPRLKRETRSSDEGPRREDATLSTAEHTRVLENQDIIRHVEFFERQQTDAKEAGALNIPGPRDFDRGKVVKQLTHDDAIHRLHTEASLTVSASDRSRSAGGRIVSIHDEEHPRCGIPIDTQGHTVYCNCRETNLASSGRSEDGKAGFSRRSDSHNVGERPRNIAHTWANIKATLTQPKTHDTMPYFAWTATTGRNSVFLDLTSEQREELGGVEYRSLKTLAKILLCYYFGFHILGMTVLLPWIMHTPPWKDTVESYGQSPAWWGVFTPASMFNDLGFTLTPNSMIGFQGSVLALLFGSFLVIVGNTGFPCMLRFIIWVLSKIVPQKSGIWEELRFLLDHPRRCFTLLFPTKATWWLFWVLVLLNGIDLIFFIILDLNQPAVADLHPGLQVLNGWFQACSTRTAGFASVNLADLHAAMQVSYVIMMYISIFPIAISVRRTNVYEEQSLGIFRGEANGDNGEQSFIGQHLRRQLSFDLWYIFLGLFIICIVEGDRIADGNDDAFTIFSVLFEIVSAYGTVGLSLGYPNVDTSFSSEFHTISKLIVIAMMVRGRHRSLPYALDRAILLPSEKLQKREAEQSERRMTMRCRGSMFAEGHERLEKNESRREGEFHASELPRQQTLDHAMAVGTGCSGSRRQMSMRCSTAKSTQSTADGKDQSQAGNFGGAIWRGLNSSPASSKRD